ncbi:sulfotransferase family protein [Streptomyces oceani]|uniref:Sulfotransferase n=1 Tax=Streptomyces oceani TaxID=1075402 RepID=A0A1E7KIV9_9ACTN|nr:sulfotransferase [Streptomyces oceani]OEV03870.1 sulfotransferase [Streptomyces oceani]
MNLRRTLNSTLRKTTGLELRQALAQPESPASKKPPEKKAEAPSRPKPVAFRPPTDPEVDRLLKQPVFIMSPVRSGSTLLRVLLNGHSQLHSPHELHIRRLTVGHSTQLAKRSMEELDLDSADLEHLLWDRVMHREVVKSGKEFIVEKTPSNAFAWKRIAACWPDARFVFLLRHPVSIARSWYEADTEKRTPESAAEDALRYMKAVERARKGLSGHTVRYEELTADPEDSIQQICAFLGVKFEQDMLSYGPRGDEDLKKGLGDWRDKIRSGSVQPGRELPTAEEIPAVLREISESWGYLDERADAKSE